MSGRIRSIAPECSAPGPFLTFLHSTAERLTLQEALRVAARLLQRPRSMFGALLIPSILPANCGILRVGLPGLEPGTSSLSGRLLPFRLVPPRSRSRLSKRFLDLPRRAILVTKPHLLRAPVT